MFGIFSWGKQGVSDDDSMLSCRCLCLHPYFHFFTLVTAFKRDLSAQQNSNFSSCAGVFSVLTAQCTVHLHYRRWTDRCQCTLHLYRPHSCSIHRSILSSSRQYSVTIHCTMSPYHAMTIWTISYLITTHSEDTAAQHHRGHQYIWSLQCSQWRFWL